MQDKQVNFCANEMLCRNITIHTLSDNPMDIICTIINTIQFTPRSEWKGHLINMNRQWFNENAKKLLNSIPILELFMHLVNDHPAIWGSLHLTQKTVGDLVAIDIVSVSIN